jgi:hypothetical protein
MFKINRRDSQGVDLPVVLDDLSDIYSIDLIITYDPQELMLNRVSKSPVVSDWLFAQAIPEPGKIKISMAGVSVPEGNGSIIDLSFSFLIGDISQLPNITGMQLNGKRISVSIENVPDRSALHQNYPNPCNTETWIPYLLSSESEVYLNIYNSYGEIVKNFNLGTQEPGHYIDISKAIKWDCKNEFGEKVSSGIYFYELHAGKYVSIKKLVIIQQK